MSKRDVVIEALRFRPVPYTPWDWGPTSQCAQRLREYLRTDDLEPLLDPHFLSLGAAIGRSEPVDENHVRDRYGVVWDRTVDKDIGTPCDWPIRTPADLDGYEFPDAGDPSWYAGIPKALARHPDRFSIYCLGFSLYERGWTLRGMVDLLMDMVDRPAFVERLLDRIVEHNLQQVHTALEQGVDAVYFGDDYGQQRGLIFGIDHWRHFIKPRLARMFAPVREAGKFVTMHSCGCVQELFDDLVEIGLNMFNPFQPEVMDVFALLPRYHGRLAFHGGMSVQKILPFGSEDEVRRQTRKLIEAGGAGGYVFSPSHAVPYDVPPRNLVAMVEELKSQPGYRP
jgi:uroporphyrinogen decarboxylase